MPWYILNIEYALLSIAQEDAAMSHVAKLFINGRSQAVRLPAAYRFQTKEVFVRQDPETGDVILSRKPASWDGFFAALKGADVPADFLDEKERNQGAQERDPFAGWRE
jgi:antitoxin VapB